MCVFIHAQCFADWLRSFFCLTDYSCVSLKLSAERKSRLYPFKSFSLHSDIVFEDSCRRRRCSLGISIINFLDQVIRKLSAVHPHSCCDGGRTAHERFIGNIPKSFHHAPQAQGHLSRCIVSCHFRLLNQAWKIKFSIKPRWRNSADMLL